MDVGLRSCPSCGLAPRAGDRYCSRCGAALPGGRSRERRTLATILFCDLVGSTALGERLDAEALRSVQQAYFATVSAALRRHGGEVEKFIGDAVMCVFGIPRAREDDALRGCLAALEIQRALGRLNQRLKPEWGVELSARIGVNTGEVVTGDARQEQALVTGDAVNTAARLEQAAVAGRVLIGELTRRLAGPSIRAVRAEPVAARGKAEPVEAHELIGIGSAPPPGDARTLVGRRRELDELLALIRAGQPGALRMLVGEPGIGKSRLAAEIAARAASAVVIQCPAHGEGAALWPLRGLAELAEDAGVPGGHALLQAAALGSDRRPDIAATRDALVGLVRAWSGAGSLVLVVEDAQWAQPQLVEVLSAVDGVPGLAALVLLAERVSGTAGHPQLAGRLVELTPLSDADADDLLVGRGVHDAGRRSALRRVGGGNPLFLEQLAAEPGDELPVSLRALLGARLDELGDEERDVIDAAAIVGREFWLGALRELTRGDAVGDLNAAVTGLVAKEFVVRGRADAPGEAPRGLTAIFTFDKAYSFRHPLVQDVAYVAAPKSRRAAGHALMADLLEERPLVPPALVAWHLERAADLWRELHGDSRLLARRAVAKLEQAGRGARAAGDREAATRLMERAALWKVG